MRNSVTLNVSITNVPPTALAGLDQSIDEWTFAYLTGAFTDPGTLDTHTIHWDFGDGNSSSGAITTNHFYPQAGVYNVVLTVKDDDGGIGTDNLTIIVRNLLPIVDAGTDKTVDEAESFSFNGIIQHPGHDKLFYYWDLDLSTDGPDADAIPNNDLDSTLLNVTHIYLDNGTYTAKLFVKDDEDSVVVDYITITVNDLAPAADAGSDHFVNTNETIIFNASAADSVRMRS